MGYRNVSFSRNQTLHWWHSRIFIKAAENSLSAFLPTMFMCCGPFQVPVLSNCCTLFYKFDFFFVLIFLLKIFFFENADEIREKFKEQAQKSFLNWLQSAAWLRDLPPEIKSRIQDHTAGQKQYQKKKNRLTENSRIV